MTGEQQQLLTADERDMLREFTAQQSCEDPRVMAVARRNADQLRKRYPGLGDEEMAAVIMQLAALAARTWHHCGCLHMRRFADLLGAVSADLAHLELDPPGTP